MDAIKAFIEDIQSVLLAVAGSVAVIGILGLSFMYLGSSWPLISDWKQNNPKAFSNTTIGLLLLVFATGGGVLALIGK